MRRIFAILTLLPVFAGCHTAARESATLSPNDIFAAWRVEVDGFRTRRAGYPLYQ